jgi:hypothetical protein
MKKKKGARQSQTYDEKSVRQHFAEDAGLTGCDFKVRRSATDSTYCKGIGV